LFFYKKEDLMSAAFNSPVRITRTIPKTPLVADAALRELFAGPTDEDHVQGARTSEDLQKLSKYYLEITIHQQYPDPTRPLSSSQSIFGVAVVNFTKEALNILNSAAARQLMAKAAIEATLRNFSTINHSIYAIDGEVFDEWDA